MLKMSLAHGRQSDPREHDFQEMHIAPSIKRLKNELK